jgi:hypothetical protein
MVTFITPVSDHAAAQATNVKICVSHYVAMRYSFSMMVMLANYGRAKDFKQPSRFAHCGHRNTFDHRTGVGQLSAFGNLMAECLHCLH